MATIPASFLNAIANPATATPVTAFLVGRENRRQRERQENQDAQQLLNDQALNELRKAQTEALRRPRAKGGFTPLNAQQKKALGIPPESFAQMGPDGKVSIDDPPRKDPLVTVNTGTKAEDAGTKKFLENVAESAIKREDQALKTFETDAIFNRMELALKRGAQTGFGEQTILTLRNAAETFGIVDLPPDAEEGEIINALSNRLALVARNPESGLGLPGSTSNKDLEFLERIVPGLSKSEGGNLLIIDAMKRMNKLMRDTAEEQQRLISENDGRIPRNLNTELIKFVNSYNVYSEEELAELEAASGGNRSIPDRVFGEDQTDDEVLNEILSR